MPIENVDDSLSCEMSTRCFTPDTLLKQTSFYVQSDTHSCSIQIGNNAFVPAREFHDMVTSSLEKWIVNL